jgi:hypothetical protein
MNDDVRGLIPAAAEVGHLKPTVGAGAFHTGVSLAIFAGGAGLATAQDMLAYSAGQLLLAVAFLHAFVLLHEAGHDTLFEQRPLNRLVGHVAGFLTVIPFWNWQRVHARHHRYTGWQDLDATTASLVPRRVPRWQQRGIDFAWATWLPLFALVYRIQNFWNIPRVFRYVGNPVNRRRILINTATVVAGYAAVLLWVGSSEAGWARVPAEPGSAGGADPEPAYPRAAALEWRSGRSPIHAAGAGGLHPLTALAWLVVDVADACGRPRVASHVSLRARLSVAGDRLSPRA